MKKALATADGKEEALKALKRRRDNKPEQIDDSKLYAGSPMHYYCNTKYCDECQSLINLGWME